MTRWRLCRLDLRAVGKWRRMHARPACTRRRSRAHLGRGCQYRSSCAARTPRCWPKLHQLTEPAGIAGLSTAAPGHAEQRPLTWSELQENLECGTFLRGIGNVLFSAAGARGSHATCIHKVGVRPCRVHKQIISGNNHAVMIVQTWLQTCQCVQEEHLG